ncbi:MAG: prepilin-type N-terminal cleavage/methylation domain-containing protein [Planctomycetota bacterium]
MNAEGDLDRKRLPSRQGRISKRTISRARDDQGFTLLELLLAMAVFAAVAAVAIPATKTLLGDQRLTRGLDQLRAEMTTLRNESVRRGRIVMVRCAEGSSEVTVEVMATTSDFADLGSTAGSQAALLSGAEQATVVMEAGATTEPRNIELPQDITVVSVATSAVNGSQAIEAATLATPVGAMAAAGPSSDMVSADGFAPIYFYPNGTSSNAVITLTHPEAGRGSVWLRGLTGSVDVGEVRANE